MGNGTDIGNVGTDGWLAAVLLLTTSSVGLLCVLLALLVRRGALGLLLGSLVFFFSCRPAGRRGVQAVHECLAALLLADLVNVVAGVWFGAQVGVGHCAGPCARAFGMWVLSRSFMEGLHLLCALLVVLFARSPRSGTRLQLAASCVALLLVCVLPFYMFRSEVAVNGESVVNCGMALVIVVMACYSSAVPGKMPVAAVAMVTFCFAYLPRFLVQSLKGPFRYRAPFKGGFSIYEKFLVFTNFQLLLDALLCFFILKLPVEERQDDDHH